jgi:xylitol oxidase
MNKREFLKLSTTFVVAGFVSPLFGCLHDEKKYLNWAGNLTYSTGNLLEPSSAEEVKDIILKQEKLKALGTKHCFNGIADSKNCLVSTAKLDKVVKLDKELKQVKVGAGVRYGQLAEYLHKEGFALHNLASLPHISVAGACATATHGSGTGNLATAVVGFDMLTAKGELLSFSRDTHPDEFDAMAVSLGAFGVITDVTLRVEPTFEVRQDVYMNLSYDQLEDNFDAIMSSGYSVSLFTTWQDRNVSEVWIKNRVDVKQPFVVKPELYGAKAATENVHPIFGVSPENCTDQMGVSGPWHERLPHFKMGFTPSKGEELQSEYFVAREYAYQGMQAIQELRKEIEPLLFMSEVRTINADDFWMSTAYKSDSVAFHFTWKPNTEGVMALLPKIEEKLKPFNPRPHWAKLFTISPEDLKSKYEKLPEFAKLVRKYDPDGKFSNDFLKKYIL